MCTRDSVCVFAVIVVVVVVCGCYGGCAVRSSSCGKLTHPHPKNQATINVANAHSEMRIKHSEESVCVCVCNRCGKKLLLITGLRFCGGECAVCYRYHYISYAQVQCQFIYNLYVYN